MDFIIEKLAAYLSTCEVTQASLPAVANHLGISIPELQEALSSPQLRKKLREQTKAQALLYSTPALNAFAKTAQGGDVKAATQILHYASNETMEDAPVIRISVEGLKE